MDWLIQGFAEQSIAWILISTFIALVAGVASSWLTYRFVTRRQIADTVEAELYKQRGILELETQKEKNERIRQVTIRWANPILGAVRDLEYRLVNILDKGGHRVLNEEYKE